MTISGLPAHVLVVHAAVVLIPLSCLLAIGFAVLPDWRWLSRWPTAAAAVGSVVLAYLATTTGGSLERSRQLQRFVVLHAQRGHLLAQLTIVLAVVAVAAAVLVPGRSGLASGKGAVGARLPYVDKVLPVLLIIAAVVVIVQTVLTGDSGARAVWGQ
jgi:hypothetical protein